MTHKNLLELGTVCWVRSNLPSIRYHIQPWLADKKACLDRQAAKVEAHGILEEFLVPGGLKELRANCVREVERALRAHGVKTPWDNRSWFVPDGLAASMGRAVAPHTAKFREAVAKVSDRWEADLKENIPNCVAAWAAAEHIGRDPFGFTDSTQWIQERSREVLSKLPSPRKLREEAAIRVVSARISTAPAVPGIAGLVDEGLAEWTEDILDSALDNLANILSEVRDNFTTSTEKVQWIRGLTLIPKLERATGRAAAWDLDQECETVDSARRAAEYFRGVTKALGKPSEEITRKKLCDALLVPLLRISDVQAREARLAKLASML